MAEFTLGLIGGVALMALSIRGLLGEWLESRADRLADVTRDEPGA
jgi:hypothetical protein